MLRTYGHGDQGGFGREDHLENYVNETAPKRKGKYSILLLKQERIEKYLNSSSFSLHRDCFVDVNGDCHSSLRRTEEGFPFRDAQAYCGISWVLRRRRLHIYSSRIMQT